MGAEHTRFGKKRQRNSEPYFIWGRRMGGESTDTSKIREFLPTPLTHWAKPPPRPHLSKPCLLHTDCRPHSRNQSWQHPTLHLSTLTSSERTQDRFQSAYLICSQDKHFTDAPELNTLKAEKERLFLNVHFQFLPMSQNQGKKQTNAKRCSREEEGSAGYSFQAGNCGSVEGGHRRPNPRGSLCANRCLKLTRF